MAIGTVQSGTEGPYVVGQPVRVWVAFFDVNKNLADPTVVTFKYLPPGQLRVVVASPDPSIIKDSIGNYHVDLLPLIAGRWPYRWEGAGALVGANDGQFVMQASPLSP